MQQRLVKREDTVSKNWRYRTATQQEVTNPDEYTPVLATELTPHASKSVVLHVATSVSVKDPSGYGKVRVTWTQGGLTQTIDESEGKVLPLGGEEYSRELALAGLTVGDAVGLTLEMLPEGATLSMDRAVLNAKEW